MPPAGLPRRTRVGMVAAVLVYGDGDVVAAGWFGHTWDYKSGMTFGLVMPLTIKR